ncbi:MAG: cytochrome c oxidase subunit II [Gammaproteobacteria bacterium]|nr:cytochrome c oxidase subunit II [Gammaproteobacteria bacterium]
MSKKISSARSLLRIAEAATPLIPLSVYAEWGMNIPPPSTSVASRILDLHNAIMIVCLIIFVIVFGVMFYSLYAHRKSRGHEAHQFSHNSKLEVVWTIIPFLILVGLAIPSTATLLYMEDTTDSDLTIKITGYQWKWQYEYLDHDINFFSNLSTPRAQIENREPKGEHYLLEVDKPMVIPANRKVRYLITSNDVIHAWWIPKFGVKKDAIPGYINEFWANVDSPGTYRGQCAELCGKDHGFMPIVAEVLPPEDFDAGLEENKPKQVASAAEMTAIGAESAAGPTASAEDINREWTMDELMEHGKTVYFQCIACHGPDGKGIPPTFPPLTGSEMTTGPLDAHIDIVMNGKVNTTMQAFKQQLNDVDIAAVITYERNALGNSVGDLVQPSEIAARR